MYWVVVRSPCLRDVQRVVGEDNAVAGQQASRGDGCPPCAGGGQQCLLARGEAELVSEDEDRA